MLWKKTRVNIVEKLKEINLITGKKAMNRPNRHALSYILPGAPQKFYYMQRRHVEHDS